jgi:hypothetical protein
MRKAMRRRPMKRVGLISMYSPKESNVRATGRRTLLQGQSNNTSPIRGFRLYASAQRKQNIAMNGVKKMVSGDPDYVS